MRAGRSAERLSAAEGAGLEVGGIEPRLDVIGARRFVEKWGCTLSHCYEAFAQQSRPRCTNSLPRPR
jgi:hypothetical protein